MIAWLAPWAFGGLVLLAGPLLVHMLLRRNARRVTFPTTKFLQATQAAAVRFRRPSDVGLMIVRLAIVLAAVLAAAHPLLLGGCRTARWDARVARAVIVDTSRSAASAPETEQLARQEMQAFAVAAFRGDDLRDSLRRASEWIVTTPPARREIVVVSDFQRGTLDGRALAAIPREIGIRFVRSVQHGDDGAMTLPPLSGWRAGDWTAAATIRGNQVDVTWSRARDSRPLEWLTTNQAAAEASATARAVRAASSFGVAPGDQTHRAVVAFAGSAAQGGEEEVRTPWMLRALVALRRSELLRESGSAVRAAERDGALIVHADVSGASAAAPAVIRAVMLAVRPAEVADVEMETATISDADLAAWRRDPMPLTSIPGGSVGDESDARWLWGAALLLLGGEAWLRRRTRVTQAEEARAHAA